jgi:hypothetical protein
MKMFVFMTMRVIDDAISDVSLEWAGMTVVT